jgi:hypothetical protein
MNKSDKIRPDLTILLKYIRGPREKMKFWSDFIENDPVCRAEVALLQRLSRLFIGGHYAVLTDASLQLADKIFQDFHSASPPTNIIPARLYFDSQMLPVPSGMRPSLMSVRRMKYRMEHGHIELAITPVYPGRFELTGRYRSEGKNMSCEIKLKGAGSRKVACDQHGFFTFSVLNPGQYSLIIKTLIGSFMIPRLVLR